MTTNQIKTEDLLQTILHPFCQGNYFGKALLYKNWMLQPNKLIQ